LEHGFCANCDGGTFRSGTLSGFYCLANGFDTPTEFLGAAAAFFHLYKCPEKISQRLIFHSFAASRLMPLTGNNQPLADFSFVRGIKIDAAHWK
jgi:hypothetical protein